MDYITQIPKAFRRDITDPEDDKAYAVLADKHGVFFRPFSFRYSTYTDAAVTQNQAVLLGYLTAEQIETLTPTELEECLH